MLPQNIIEILKKLDKKESKRLGDFIKSPYFNSIGKLEDLYDVIVKEYPAFPGEKLDDKKVFKKLYPGKEYKDKTIKNLYLEFGKLFRKFLAYEEIFPNEELIDLNLAKALSRKGAYGISDKIINEKMEKTKYKDLGRSYYLYMYKLEVQRYHNLFKEKKMDFQEIYNSLHSTAEDLAGFFFSTFSNAGYHMLFSLETQNIDCGNRKLLELIKSFDSKKLLDYLDASGLKNSTVVKIYYLFLNSFVNGFTEKEYYEIKEILIKNSGSFSKIDILNFWTNTMDLLLFKLVPLDKKFYREVIDLSKYFSSLNIYPDKSIDDFPYHMLRNIIFSGLILDEYEWAESFLNEYSNYIDPEYKKNELNYNKGLLYFNYKKHEESLLYLNNVKITDIYENLSVRFYMLMNHIELKNYDSAESMINSIKQFYRSNKDIPELIGGLAKTSLKYLAEIIKCEQAGTKINYSFYKEALGPKRCYNKKYILSKMKAMV
jgi:hypothetical protein